MDRTAGLYISNNRVTPVSDSNRTTIPGLSGLPSGRYTGYVNSAAVLCSVVTSWGLLTVVAWFLDDRDTQKVYRILVGKSLRNFVFKIVQGTRGNWCRNRNSFVGGTVNGTASRSVSPFGIMTKLRAGIGSLHATSGAHPAKSSLYSIFFSGRKTVSE
jgi:hypothetical protein